MNVSSLELSKTLFELSGWKDTSFGYDTSYADNWLRHLEDFGEDTRERRGFDIYPAYDVGYLLRKLPKVLDETIDNAFKYEEYYFDLQLTWDNEENCWKAWYVFLNYEGVADTPEDCLAKLAIGLFKQGILKKET